MLFLILFNSWLISAIAGIADHPDHIKKVIPYDQSFEEGDYAGIFHFRIWQFGQWFDVVVDDRLPVRKNLNCLAFCHNEEDRNEMFGPLLEKAFAKLYTCYQYLAYGYVYDAAIDLTGGVHETFDILNPSETFNEKNIDNDAIWEIMFASHKMKSFCGTHITSTADLDKAKELGLVPNHAYSILSVIQILANGKDLRNDLKKLKKKDKEKSIRLLKMRNPWGEGTNYAKWNGAWSSGKSDWDHIDKKLRNTLTIDGQKDGQFYISYEDFCEFFDCVNLVHISLDAFYDSTSPEYDMDIRWHEQRISSEWITGKNAGGN
jgi:calpain, invertebrate